MSKKAQTINLIIASILIISVFISLLIYIGYCIKAGSKANVVSEGNVTELTDAADIKKRMEFHGCLICQKDPAGVWWFRRDDRWRKLWSPEQHSKEEN